MKKPFKKKRIIEIYFVLYLMALILILPGKKEDGGAVEDEASSNIFEFPFSLKPVSNILNAKILIDRDSVTILNMDSLNTIYYTGDVQDIDFEFVVEDLSINSEVKIDNNNNTNKFFKIQEDENRQAAVFSWVPPLNDPSDKTYLVTVNAKIKPNNTDDIAEDITVSTEFSINVDFLTPKDLATSAQYIDGGEFLDDDTQIFPAGQMVQAPSMNTGDLLLMPSYPVIKALAGDEWSNSINLSGINLQNELSKKPEIKVIHNPAGNGGTGNVKIITKDNQMFIEGVAPDFGTNKIIITVTRIDGTKAEANFIVSPSEIGTPKIPKVMYPEITYVLDPQMPVVSNTNSYCILRTTKGQELEKIFGSDKLKFTPTRSDTGQSVYLERYLNNRLIDKTKKIRIVGNPPPKIIIQKNESNEVTIATFSRGFFNGRENTVEKLIIEGNAEYFSLSGQMRVDSRKHTYDQHFKVMPKDKSKPFTFTIQAVSVEGKKSEILRK